MSSRYVVRALILAGLMPAGAMALGLGDIHLKSALNAPLEAEIDLTATAEELRGLKVALASRESFSRYGLDYPAYFDTVTLVPGKSADGHDVLQVHSGTVATEPFATLLIEATWARGRLVREYTVLLDPPVFTGDKASPAAAVAAPEAAPEARSGSVERPAPAEAEAPAAPAASAPTPTSMPAKPAAGAPAGSYVVQRGDTLSAIAAQHYPNGQRERALVALYKANPSAFEGNMNVLHAGATLQVPDQSSLAAIAPGEANAEVSSQYRAWAGAHADGGRLHLVPPSEAGSATPGKAAAGETAALQERITTLQGQLAESQRLLELKNAELARLQQQINPGSAARAPVPPAVPTPSTPPEAAPNPAPKEAPAPVAAAPKEAPTAAPPPAKHAPAAVARESGGGLIDWLVSNWYLLLGVVVVLLAAMFGFRKFKARHEQDFGSTLGRLSSPSFESTAAASRPAETQPMRTLPSKQDPSFVVEESGTHPVPRMGGGEPAQLRPVPVAVDDALSASGTAVALDQGDPLAEADFHMAYGLYDQAADLVRIAIAREPQRRDLQLKLLEVFFVWGNKDQFLHLARELSAKRDQALPGEWEKIVIMGRQIAPEDPLFASPGGLHGVGSAGVDLNLEGGQNRVDFDLLGDPTVTTDSAGGAVDLDLGAALGGNEATGEARAVGDTGVDFVLDDPARGGDATGSTREMQQSPTVTLEFGDPSQDSPTVENFMTSDIESPTIRQKLDASSRNLMMSADPTAELAVVDLGLHVSGGDTGQHFTADGDSSSTAMTGLDEDTRKLFSKAHSESHDTELMPSSPGGSASGTWLFTDKDMGVDLPPPAADDAPTALATAIMPGTAAGQGLTAQLEALKGQGGGDVDLDLGGLDMTGEPGGALDLDVGHSAAPSEGAFAATQRLSGQPLMNESEPATMSEVGTKLDLARAYMDMGDPEGARSILEEVLAEGSASQKTEARRLVDSLPG
jgi:pilus assembly protein FimV